jgi:membrane protein YqaA with SNARE-associated domain
VTDDLLSILGIYGGTFVVSIIAAVLPLVNSEVFLVGVVRLAVDRVEQLPALAVAAALGQMVGKIGLYYAGMGMLELPRGKYKAKIEEIRVKLEKWKSKPYMIFAISAAVGLPPFYFTVLAAGAMKIRFKAFFVIGLIGRTLRFAVVIGIAWWA